MGNGQWLMGNGQHWVIQAKPNQTKPSQVKSCVCHFFKWFFG